MFEFLKGGVQPADTLVNSRLAMRTTQFLTVIFLLAPLAGTVYAVFHLWSGLTSLKDIYLFIGFYVATALGVTIGFHRMLTHKSFETNPILRGFFLILGAWAIQGAAISWAALHAKHHTYSDTDDDPHSPVKNFAHGHVTWMLGPLRAEPEKYVKSQLQDPVVMFVSRTAFFWAVLGMLLPFFIGGFSGFLWGGLVRVFVLHHVTWAVNSVCHTFGSRTYETAGSDHSTNNWLVGLLSMGEGWHNNHHAFPRSAYHGLKRRQVDVTGYIIRVLGMLGLAKNITTISPELRDSRAKKGPGGSPPSVTEPVGAG
jgi:stearoyl-CoA desaturase (delta-9 desaturase)